MIIDPLIDSYKQSSQTRVGTKNTPDSVTPTDVAGCDQDLAEIVRIVGNEVNNFDLLGNTLPPLNSSGVDDDIYIQGGTTLRFYKKIIGVWTLKVSVPLGITIQNGNINLQPRVSGFTITVPPGQWGINNQIYTKAAQDQFTINAADANLDRIDAVFAKTDSTVYYVAGTASANPDATKPTTPANQVIVTYVYVPSVASGGMPYINDSNSSPSVNPLVLTGGTAAPTGGNDGDVYIQNDGSIVTFYQKATGTWTAIQNFSVSGGGGSGLPTGGTAGQTLEKISSTDGDAEWVDIPQKIQDQLDAKAPISDGRISGGEISVISTNTIRVAPASWRISASNYETLANTDFPGITNSSSGNQRYIAFFGNTFNQIVKVEGAEGSIAIMPNIPNNTVLISYVLVNDAGIGSGEVDLSGYLEKTDYATDTELESQNTPSENNKYVSSRGLRYFWNWLRGQVINFTNTVTILQGSFGTTSPNNSHVTIASNTNTVSSLGLKPSSTDYTGTQDGNAWNILGEIKIITNGIVNRFVKNIGNQLFIGTDERLISTNSDGDLISSYVIKSRWILNTDVISAIQSATFSTDKIATITPVTGKAEFGQMWYDNTKNILYLSYDAAGNKIMILSGNILVDSSGIKWKQVISTGGAITAITV